MVTKSFDSLGVSIKLSVPETVEEFNKLDAARPNACLDEAINNVVYRGALAEFRSKFVEEVVKACGYTPELDEDENWKDSEGLVFKKALLHAKRTAESFQELAQTIADGIVFDPTARARGAGSPKKIAKVYLEAADAIIAQNKAEAVAEKLSGLLGVAVAADKESLARAISANEARKRAEAQAKMVQSYASLEV